MREEREDDDGRSRLRLVRSGAGKGFLRGRIHCRHQGPPIAQTCPGRADHSAQPRASRRGRRRSARRRWRRYPGADAAQVPCQEGCRNRLRPARPRSLCGRRAVHAARRGLAAGDHGHLRRNRGAGRHEGSRLARRADRQFDARRIGQAHRAGAQAGLPRAQPADGVGRGFRAPALHPAQDHLLDALRQARAAALQLLPGVDLVPHADLQGYVPRRSARHLLPRSARSGFRERARAHPPALLDQHVPDLVARASLPHDRPQRRDQHAARQQQLDGGAAGVGVIAEVRRRHQQAVADLLRRPVRHRLLRQRARIPDHGRLPARPCDDDDDTGGVGG